MLNNIIERFKNKNIAILGFGREGRSSYKFIRTYLKEEKITILDKNQSLKSDEIFKGDNNVYFSLGEEYLNDLDSFDIILKTSGISLNSIDISKLKEKIVSQYSLFLENTKNKVIGITGTKGKSTTSTLMYEVLKENKVPAIFAGNIGIPIFDKFNEINEDTIIVLELSAYQLEYINKAPFISILLNLHEEHLDYFKTKDNYFNAKLNIFKMQGRECFGFYLKDDKSYIKNFDSTLYEVEGKDLYIKDNYIYFKDERLFDINEKRNILGRHNLTNIMFVLGVSRLLDLDIQKTTMAIRKFKGLEHRLEFVGKYNDIIFYNDSIATIPDATINAIETLKDVDTLIFGGMDRGIDYSKLVEYLKISNIKNLICMPDTGYKIGKELEFTHKNIYYLDDMKKVVEKAKEVTEKEKICLMSPAAPSYNKYKNFEEKGKDYKEKIKE